MSCKTIDILHNNGYMVIPSGIEIPIEVLENLTKQVNCNKGEYVKQCNVSKRAKYVDRFINNLNSVISTLCSEYSNWVVMCSKPNFLRQRIHDYYHETKGEPEESNISDNKFNVICAIMNNTTFNIQPCGVEISVTLKPGDLLIFRGDFTHVTSLLKEGFKVYCYMNGTTILPCQSTNTN